MNIHTLLGNGSDIARAEWTRHHREFGQPLTGRPVLLVGLVAIGIVLGWFSHSLGRDLAAGQPLPYDVLSLLVSIEFAWMVWRSSRYTRNRFERLNPDFLLTTVPARTAAIGLLGFVYARLLTTLAIPTFGVAVGTAVGLRSPTVALTVALAVVGLAALAVALGTAGRLAARLVALRLARARFYRDVLVVFGWIPLIVGAIVLQDLPLSIAPLFAVFGALPLAWFADLALVGGLNFAFGSLRHALGALGITVATVPVFLAVTTALARRIWESEPVSSTGAHGSHSLVANGWVARLLGNRISRPTLTVAKERWLIERRVPRGLLSIGYVLLFFGVIVFPVLLFGGPNGFLLLVAISLGLSAGIAFATDPIGTEYRTLPMLFTTVTGYQFVGGLVLAAIVVGAPLVTLLLVSLGIISVVGTVQSLLITLVGITSCACSASVSLAVGLGIDRREFVPTPFFFTDIPIFAEHGLNAFLRLGSVFGIVMLANGPAFLGNAPSVTESLAAFGMPAVGVQIGSLLITLLLIVAVTRIAFRIAVQRFRDYQIG